MGCLLAPLTELSAWVINYLRQTTSRLQPVQAKSCQNKSAVKVVSRQLHHRKLSSRSSATEDCSTVLRTSILPSKLTRAHARGKVFKLPEEGCCWRPAELKAGSAAAAGRPRIFTSNLVTTSNGVGRHSTATTNSYRCCMNDWTTSNHDH